MPLATKLHKDQCICIDGQVEKLIANPYLRGRTSVLLVTEHGRHRVSRETDFRIVSCCFAVPSDEIPELPTDVFCDHNPCACKPCPTEEEPPPNPVPGIGATKPGIGATKPDGCENDTPYQGEVCERSPNYWIYPTTGQSPDC